MKSMSSDVRVFAHSVVSLSSGASASFSWLTAVDVGLTIPFVMHLRSASAMSPMCRFETIKFKRWGRVAGAEADVGALFYVFLVCPFYLLSALCSGFGYQVALFWVAEG